MAKQPAAGGIEAATKALKQVERTGTMEMTALMAETNRLQQEKAEREHRERMIAQCHEMIGQVKAVSMISKFGDVTNLMWMKEVKESKIYKDVPGIGTWEKFCNLVGKDRHTIDQDLLNLSTFGEEFLVMVTSLKVGYKDLRKLRQLSYDGSVIIDAEAETITIDGQTIPFNEEHTDEVQAAIESIISNNAALNKKVDRLLNDVKGIVKEETLGLKCEKDALLEEVKRLKAFDPEQHDREWSVAMMEEVREASLSLEVAIQKFVIDPRLVGDRPLQAHVWSHLTAATDQLEDLDKRMRDVFYSDED